MLFKNNTLVIQAVIRPITEDICHYAVVRIYMGKATQDFLILVNFKLLFSNERRVVIYISLTRGNLSFSQLN